VVERLVTPTESSPGSATEAAQHARDRWSAADIESSWTRVQSGTSATYRSPRLDLGPDFHSIVIARPRPRPRPPNGSPIAAPILLWSETPVLGGAAFTRNRRELPIAQKPATVIMDAESLQSDQRRPVQYLFLHVPDDTAVDLVVESIAVITTHDLAAAGARMTRIATDGETRDAFAARAPLRFLVNVPDNAQLAFGVRTPSGTPAARVRVTQSFEGNVFHPFEATLTSGQWLDFRTPLRPSSGSTVTLSTDAVTDGAAPVYWSVPLLMAPETSDDRPNVMVIVVDALRADVLGTYGARQSAMPLFDDLASTSVVFQRAYAAASWTKPSIATLLTSLYPWTHALGARYYADALPREVLTLQGVLSEYGYVTAQFSANPFTGAVSGLDRGFDTAVMAHSLGHQNAFAVTAADIVDRVLSWVTARADDRYFAYVHLVDTHGARGLDGYRAAASIADREIERLRSRLNQLPGGAHTLFIITADHGEAFGDHGHSGHGQSVYEEEIRVPLIIQEPRQTSGRIVNEPVHLVDVMPTVLDYAGITLDRAVMQGRSLRANDGALKPSPVIVTKFTYPDDVVISGEGGVDMHAVVDFPWKLIVTERRAQPRMRELYRLDSDAGEKNNLADTEVTRARQLEAALDAFLRDQASARARFASTYERGVTAAPAPARELVDQLRSLGYVR
jgi:arylsulfatase A-like enzyme